MYCNCKQIRNLPKCLNQTKIQFDNKSGTFWESQDNNKLFSPLFLLFSLCLTNANFGHIKKAALKTFIRPGLVSGNLKIMTNCFPPFLI